MEIDHSCLVDDSGRSELGAPWYGTTGLLPVKCQIGSSDKESAGTEASSIVATIALVRS